MSANLRLVPKLYSTKAFCKLELNLKFHLIEFHVIWALTESLALNHPRVHCMKPYLMLTSKSFFFFLMLHEQSDHIFQNETNIMHTPKNLLLNLILCLNNFRELFTVSKSSAFNVFLQLIYWSKNTAFGAFSVKGAKKNERKATR